jgi:hypothetical protein
VAAFLRLSNAETFSNVISLYERPNADENNNNKSEYDIQHSVTTKNSLYIYIPFNQIERHQMCFAQTFFKYETTGTRI